uniref:Glycosyltransferase n=1 Tax=Tanacetum cinerariifolium TaxID=118510 RepID=A0A699GZY3_TANCI|nr:anthocyanidin 3-O-glucosyltransferase 2-like [Tanacetum cinerariifolium]
MENTFAELIFIPIPGVGHIMSTIEMAKVLVNRDQRLSITVLIIDPPYTSLALASYIESLAKNTIERIRLNVVADMINQPGFGSLGGFVVDILSSSMIDVANEFNVPTYVFFTSNAAFLGFKVYMETLCADQNQDYVIELSKAEGEILLPSFVKPVPTKVFPQVYQTEDGLDFLMYSIRKMREAKAIMVNTFLELERHAIKSFSNTNFPPLYPVGPILNLDGVVGKAEDRDVIGWLDDQPPCSVVFLCFGSMGSFNEVQVKEIAYGLERSGYRFVWSLRRPPLPTQSFKVLPDDFSDSGAVLPDGFQERTMGKGKVIGWAPQVLMLAHPAVGGFVSHCGWNSMLESLWFGVPVATCPMYTEQQMNAFEMVVELGLAVEIKMDYKNNVFNPESDMVIISAEEIEKGIRRLMEDNEVRAKVKAMSKLSRASVTEGGSSYASVGCLVQDFTSNNT